MWMMGTGIHYTFLLLFEIFIIKSVFLKKKDSYAIRTDPAHTDVWIALFFFFLNQNHVKEMQFTTVPTYHCLLSENLGFSYGCLHRLFGSGSICLCRFARTLYNEPL